MFSRTFVWNISRSKKKWARYDKKYIGLHVKYVVGSKSFRPDIEKPRQMENAVRDI